MKIIVIGKGICGKATGLIFGGDVDFHDPAKGEVIDNTSIYDFAFICVPTPGIQSETYNYEAVDDAIVHLLKTGFDGISVIRSTCDPQYLKRITEVYEKTIHWPEFLREFNYEYDARYPENVVIGGATEYTESLVTLLKQYKHQQLAYWKITDIVSASIIKMGLNSALAAKIAMFNSIKEVCEAEGANWETVRLTISNDSRIAEGQTLVPGPDNLRGFGGKCLPKDLDAFASLANKNVYLESIRLYNNKIRN